MRLKLDPAELRRLFRYDKRTGRLYWRKRDDVPRKWNSKWAGKPAGSESERRICINIRRRTYKAHRIVWAIVYGKDPGRLEVDHIDGDGTNNRLSNLRLATRSQNMQNQRARRDPRLKGVTHHRGRYIAQIGVAGRHFNLGQFKTAREAHAAYVIAAEEFHGEFACVGR